jgi:hypothetical protein
MDMKGILPFTITILVLLTCGGSRATADNAPLPDALPGLRVAGPELQGCYDDGQICGQAVGACGTSQWFFYCDLEFCSGTLCRRVRTENFPPPGVTLDPNDPYDWIGVITWYGVYINDAAGECTKTNGHQFRVRFYPEANQPDPNGYIYEQFLTAVAYDTGATYDFGSGPTTVWYWTATLANPLALAGGWFSLVGFGTPGCYHLWQGAHEGDHKFANWFESNIPATYEIRTTFCDINYCFWQNIWGACCDDRTGVCEEHVFQNTCNALGGRLLLYQPCSALDPPCGEGLGACCFDDGTCELLTYAACTAAGDCDGDANCDGAVDFDDIGPFVGALAGTPPCRFGNVDVNNDGALDFDDIDAFIAALGQPCPLAGPPEWRGPNTTCATCCTLVGAGEPREGEPLCGPDYVDTYNGGCDAAAPAFLPLPLGVTVYGMSGTYTAGGQNRRDTDWYEFTLSESSKLTLTVAADFPAAVWILHAGTCDPNAPDGYWTVAVKTVAACSELQFQTHPIPAGTYWLVVAPQFHSGLECGVDYRVSVQAEAADLCTISCAPTYTELEACGDNTNPGCDGADPGDPNNWEPLPLTPGVPFTICGTLWAVNGARDTDWYSFTLPVQGMLAWEYQSEIPIITTPIFGGLGMEPPYCWWTLYGYWYAPPVQPCHLIGGVQYMEPDGIFRANTTYWWIVLPDDGESLYNGYPCSVPQGDYRVTITSPGSDCPDVCTGAAFPEDEPGCGPGYVDTFNGGCDAATFAIRPAIYFLSGYCGWSGTWVENNQTMLDYDWWRIQLTGNVNKRLRINMRSEFDMIWELYRILDPNHPCSSAQRLDYYEFLACEPALNFYTRCLQPSSTKYYAMRIFPARATPCTDHNTYQFSVAVESETPACALCAVTCSTSPDDACQDDPNDPATNEGCNVTPNVFMPFQVGNNTYGPSYCGRTSTYVDGSGYGRVDLDWFELTMPVGRTKLLIRGKAEFRMSINLATSCEDPGTAHGWDRACKGTTSPFVNTWTGLTAATQYYGVIIYGNGGGDGTGENPLVQFFSGLPCSETFNEWQVELQAQP